MDLTSRVRLNNLKVKLLSSIKIAEKEDNIYYFKKVNVSKSFLSTYKFLV